MHVHVCTSVSAAMVKSVCCIFIAIITARIRLIMTCLVFDGDVSVIASLPVTNISTLCN